MDHGLATAALDYNHNTHQRVMNTHTRTLPNPGRVPGSLLVVDLTVMYLTALDTEKPTVPWLSA